MSANPDTQTWMRTDNSVPVTDQPRIPTLLMDRRMRGRREDQSGGENVGFVSEPR